jgi:hypothetical protein
MMTPKERAEKLVRKFAYEIREKEDKEGFVSNINIAKKCALIALDEILDIRNGLYVNEGSIIHQYLLDVKKEIELI